MQKKIIGIATVSSIGATFLDWSIHFLSGNDKFYHIKTCKLEPLTTNPLSSINAHSHKKNHPSGFDESQQHIDKFLHSSDNLLTLYPIPIHLETILSKLNIDLSMVQDNAIYQNIQQYQLDDYSKLLEYILDCNGDLIYLDNNVPLYDLNWRSIETTIISRQPVDTTADVEAVYQNVFFGKSLKKWKDIGLTQIWDIRERLALDERPLAPIRKPKIDFSRRHCFIDSMEWFTNGVNVIKRVMNFCNLKIHSSRWDAWVDIHNQWQTLHKERLNFCYQLPHIVDATVNNWYYDIDLTFEQEVVVQHCLIYQHNLNLKTWQLEKFPNNTQELHKLLEDNIHPIGDV